MRHFRYFFGVLALIGGLGSPLFRVSLDDPIFGSFLGSGIYPSHREQRHEACAHQNQEPKAPAFVSIVSVAAIWWSICARSSARMMSSTFPTLGTVRPPSPAAGLTGVPFSVPPGSNATARSGGRRQSKAPAEPCRASGGRLGGVAGAAAAGSMNRRSA